jgi:tocopherol O-methyltransferase
MSTNVDCATTVEPSAAQQARAVVAYYDNTDIDYRLVWQNRRNLAFHFGYFDATTRSHAAALENTNRTLAELVGIRPGDRVLDAGCGTGGSSFWLAANRGTQVVGVNLVDGAVAQAQRNAVKRGLERMVRFDRADYTALPYEDASFDVVWALESVCHATSKSAFYREAARVLRPGGRLVLAEYMRQRRDIPERDERIVRTWLDGWAIPDLDTGEEHIASARAAGFEDVRVLDFTPRARRSLRRLYHRAIVAIPIDAVLRALRQRNAVQSANVLSSFLQYRALLRGAWFYAVLTATRT